MSWPIERPDAAGGADRFGEAQVEVARSGSEVRHTLSGPKGEGRHHLIRSLRGLAFRPFEHSEVLLDSGFAGLLRSRLLLGAEQAGRQNDDAQISGVSLWSSLCQRRQAARANLRTMADMAPFGEG